MSSSTPFDAAAAAATLCGHLSFDHDGAERRVNMLQLLSFTTNDRAKDAIPRHQLTAVFALLTPMQRDKLMFDVCYLGDDRVLAPNTYVFSTPDPTRGFSAEERAMWLGKLARRGLAGEQLAWLALAHEQAELALVAQVVATTCKLSGKLGFLSMLAEVSGGERTEAARAGVFTPSPNARAMAVVLGTMTQSEQAIALGPVKASTASRYIARLGQSLDVAGALRMSREGLFGNGMLSGV